jgi:hypothetical protein
LANDQLKVKTDDLNGGKDKFYFSKGQCGETKERVGRDRQEEIRPRNLG